MTPFTATLSPSSDIARQVYDNRRLWDVDRRADRQLSFMYVCILSAVQLLSGRNARRWLGTDALDIMR